MNVNGQRSCTDLYLYMYIHTLLRLFLPRLADEVPSDNILRQFARPVAQNTKNWARLALYLGLLPTEAANSQYYQVHV